MQKVTLSATERTDSGKGLARSLRREGSIPAVIYKAGKADSLTLNHKEMINFINKTRGEKALITLDFGASQRLALMKEYQVDPVDNILLHADFMEIDMNVKVRVPLRVKLVGDPIGVKRDKGVVEQLLREVEIEALPNDIPGRIELDITELAAGFSLHVSDVTAPEGVSILTSPSESVAACSIPKVIEEVVEEELEEGAEGAEGGAEEGAEAKDKEKAEDEKKEE